MMKRLIASCSILLLALAANLSAAEPVRIGVTFQSLSMPTFAEFSSFMRTYAPEKYGAEITIVSAEWNAPTQVSQIENFIESGVDAIIIAPVDPNAVFDVTQRAQEAGIYVFSYAAHIANYDAEYLVDDYNTGYACGAEAAKWINEKLGGKTEYGLLEYPINDRLIQRAQGLQDAIAKLAPETKLVAVAKAVDANEGMRVTEDMLQANPDMQIIVSIGDGGAIGANEVVMAANKASDTWGIFAVDATQEALQKIKDNEPFRCSMSLGGPIVQGSYMVDTVVSMARGEPVTKNGLMPYLAITKDNVEEYAKSVNWNLR
ncbi:MAG: sugar ABC transporter substrate-binding protein [Planctomycetes bacterium]|nr:sugar ABC transporter substrate-binding protein [Planctomycetota bacterium]